MAGEIDGEKFMQLCGEVFFYDEDLLCAIDVRSERFGIFISVIFDTHLASMSASSPSFKSAMFFFIPLFS